MKRIITAALAALLIVGAPIAVLAQAEAGGTAPAAEQPTGAKKKTEHKAKKKHHTAKKSKKKAKPTEGEMKK
jgi:Ni/Co efflux regulator RcnB